MADNRLRSEAAWSLSGPALLAAVLLLLPGCDSSRSGNVDDDADAPIWDDVASVLPADVAKLRWIEGDWRGSGGGYEQFYERYEFDGDSVLRQYSFSDSTFGQAVDTSVVRLYGDSLFSESGERRYVASALRDTSVTFAPYARALNGFTWRRTSDTSWVAILTPVDTTRPRVEYRMIRIRE